MCLHLMRCAFLSENFLRIFFFILQSHKFDSGRRTIFVYAEEKQETESRADLSRVKRNEFFVCSLETPTYRNIQNKRIGFSALVEFFVVSPFRRTIIICVSCRRPAKQKHITENIFEYDAIVCESHNSHPENKN